MRSLVRADGPCMASNRRPPLYWKTWLVAGPLTLIGLALLVINGLALLAGAFALLAVAGFFGPWFLSPYSKVARRIAWPSDADLDRSERFADRLGSLPLFGALWRGAERLTGNAGRHATEEYRRWQHEQDDRSA